MARNGGIRRLFGAAMALGMFATALVAQPPGDPIAEARARQKIADQKLTINVNEAIRDADTAAKTNPAKAAQILRAAQSAVTDAPGISGEARKNRKLSS